MLSRIGVWGCALLLGGEIVTIFGINTQYRRWRLIVDIGLTEAQHAYALATIDAKAGFDDAIGKLLFESSLVVEGFIPAYRKHASLVGDHASSEGRSEGIGKRPLLI
jgi:hypothetical protein